MKTTIEICTGSLSDCIAAYEGGADRVELNSAMYLGGLTPTVATLKLVKKHCPGLKIISMVRPRGAGFCYTDTEYEVCLAEAKDLLENGSDGIVFGFLNEDFTFDLKRMSEMVSLVSDYGKEAVVHRAYDCAIDQDSAIEALIRLKINRILTSGGAPDAVSGIPQLSHLQKTYGNEIELLAGSGVRSENAIKIIKETGISQIHSSCGTWDIDKTTDNGKISYGFDSSHPTGYNITSPEGVKNLVKTIRAM